MTTESGPEEPATGQPPKRGGWVIFAIAGLVIALCIGAAFRGVDDQPPDLEGDAKRVCQEVFIPKRLKAPSTADFSGVSVTGSGGDVYTVTGDVDAQNSFGAKIRSRFTCIVRHTGDRWALVSAAVS